MGSLYRRPNSPFVWCQYYANGRQVRESTGTAKEKAAQDFLKRREGAVANHAPIPPRTDKVRYDELAADLRAYYQTTGKRDLVEAETRLAHLDRYFRGWRVVQLAADRITQYVEQRQAPIAHADGPVTPGAANGTINRELAVLSRMLRLGYRHGKVLRLPVIEKLAEAPPRAGFFEAAQYEAVRRQLAPDLQVATAIAYTFGWRTQSEVLTRERRHLDLETGTLCLDPGETKNGEPRLVYLTPELAMLLDEQLARVDALQKRLGRIVPFLFPHLTGHHAGTRRRDYRKAWASACKAAGVAGRLRHDFRRTAVRNMINHGVVEKVAMMVTGHQTRSVFDRYHIVAPEDLKAVARKLAGTLPGTTAGAHDAAHEHTGKHTGGHTGGSTGKAALQSVRK